MRSLSVVVMVACCVTMAACDQKKDIPDTPAEIAKEAPVTSKTSPELVQQQTSLVAADSGTVSDF